MILITGASGFIGSHLCEKIPNTFGLDKLDRGQKKDFISLDLLDKTKLFWFMKDMKFEYVLHNAAVAGVPQSYDDPMTTYLNNVNATINLIDVCQSVGVKKLVMASTSSINGPSPYGHSKRVCEEIIYKSGINHTILRYFNVFGFRQRNNVLATMLFKLKHDHTIEIFGDGSATRDFTYIDNVVLANKKAMSEEFDNNYDLKNGPEFSEVGTEKPHSLITLYNKMKTLVNPSHNKLVFSSKRIGDIGYSCADTFLENEEIIHLDEGLKLWLKEENSL